VLSRIQFYILKFRACLDSLVHWIVTFSVNLTTLSAIQFISYLVINYRTKDYQTDWIKKWKDVIVVQF